MGKFCSNCGAQIQEISKFCSACGVPVKSIGFMGRDGNEQSQSATASGQTITPPLPVQRPVQPVQDAPAQQAPQTAQHQQSYAFDRPSKKKSKLPLILGIAGGVVAVIVIAVILILNGAKAALDKTAKADYYEIGNDKIPSVKLALGEARTVTGVSTSVKNDATIKEITYSVPSSEQNKEMSAYLSYLHEKDGFLTLTDSDFSAAEAFGVVGRNSLDDGYEILLQIGYNQSGYTITLVRQKGGVTPNATPAPESTPEPVPEPTPAIVAKSVFEPDRQRYVPYGHRFCGRRFRW